MAMVMSDVGSEVILQSYKVKEIQEFVAKNANGGLDFVAGAEL